METIWHFYQNRLRRVCHRRKSVPVEGADVGDTVEMGGLLGSAPLMPVHEASSADFIARGGRIPAPLQSLKN